MLCYFGLFGWWYYWGSHRSWGGRKGLFQLRSPVSLGQRSLRLVGTNWFPNCCCNEIPLTSDIQLSQCLWVRKGSLSLWEQEVFPGSLLWWDPFHWCHSAIPMLGLLVEREVSGLVGGKALFLATWYQLRSQVILLPVVLGIPGDTRSIPVRSVEARSTLEVVNCREHKMPGHSAVLLVLMLQTSLPFS